MAAGARIAYLRTTPRTPRDDDGRVGRSSGRPDALGARSDRVRLQSAAAALAPSELSLRIAGCVAVPAVGYFAWTTAVASLYAAVMAGASWVAGEAVDALLLERSHADGDGNENESDENLVMQVNTAAAVLFGAPSVGGLVTATGLSLTTMWLTSQVGTPRYCLRH